MSAQAKSERTNWRACGGSKVLDGYPLGLFEEAAERRGLHRTYYSGVERGVSNVSLVNIEKITRALKKTLPSLFDCL